MGVRWSTSFTTTIVNATIVTTAETIIATTAPINLTQDGALVLLLWSTNILAGTGVTNMQYLLRRGTLVTSPLINANVNEAQTAAVAAARGGSYPDSPGIVAEQQYTLTVIQLGATGNGTVRDVFLAAIVM